MGGLKKRLREASADHARRVAERRNAYATAVDSAIVEAPAPHHKRPPRVVFKRNVNPLVVLQYPEVRNG